MVGIGNICLEAIEQTRTVIHHEEAYTVMWIRGSVILPIRFAARVFTGNIKRSSCRFVIVLAERSMYREVKGLRRSVKANPLFASTYFYIRVVLNSTECRIQYVVV